MLSRVGAGAHGFAGRRDEESKVSEEAESALPKESRSLGEAEVYSRNVPRIRSLWEAEPR